MSTIVINKCDKCGNEFKSTELFKVGVFAYPFTGSINTYSPHVTKDHVMDVCRPCINSYGIFVAERDRLPDSSPPTLEDIIIDIVTRTVEDLK